MTRCSVHAVRAVELGVTDLETATRFFTDVWNLAPASSTNESVDLRGTATFHHILTLHRAPHAGVIRIVLDARDRATTDALYEQVRSVGAPVDGVPRMLEWSGGAYGFGCKDPEGRSFAIVSGVADHLLVETDHDAVVGAVATQEAKVIGLVRKAKAQSGAHESEAGIIVGAIEINVGNLPRPVDPVRRFR